MSSSILSAVKYDRWGLFLEKIEKYLGDFNEVHVVIDGLFQSMIGIRKLQGESTVELERSYGEFCSMRSWVGAIRSILVLARFGAANMVIQYDVDTGFSFKRELDAEGRRRGDADYLGIAFDIGVLAARIFGFASFLHNQKVVQYSKEVQNGLSIGTSVAWGIVMIIDFITGVIGLIGMVEDYKAGKEFSKAEWGEKITSVGHSISQAFLMPFETGLYRATEAKMMIVSGAIYIGSGTLGIAKAIFKHITEEDARRAKAEGERVR